MKISDRLDKAMKAAGFKTQAALAAASGIPQPTVNRILKGTGKRGPETETIKQLASACGVSFIWLAEGSGEQYAYKANAPKHEDNEIAQETLAKYDAPAPRISLIHVTDAELEILTAYNAADGVGKKMIESAARKAPKDLTRLQLIESKN